ncbi:MAG: hypothetical protein ABJB05_01125 [Parafilimonas sp.]
MKKRSFLILLIIIAAKQFCFCQVNEDSAMLANSERWQVKLNKGLFGLSKPDFGPYKTIEVIKLDSAVIKKKTKDSASFDAEFFGSGSSDFDQSKYMTIEKKKFYQLSLGATSGATKATFAIASVSHEKRQTVLGKIMSKDDEGKNEDLSYKRDIYGVIIKESDSIQWNFFIKDFDAGSGQSGTPFFIAPSITGAWLKHDDDSIYVKTYSSFGADILLVNQKGAHVAALAFKQKHSGVWIRNDIDASYQKIIAAFFAVFIAIKDY